MLKNFHLNIIARVLLLAVTMAVCMYLWLNSDLYIGAGLLSLIVIYQIIRLIQYVDLTNQTLSRFFNSVRYSDFSRTFSGEKLGASFDQLNETMTEVIEKFKEQRIEKQSQFRYMENVVEHIGVGLISFNQEGEIELLNNAAKRLFQIPTLRNVSGLNEISPAFLNSIRNLKTSDYEIVTVTISNKTMQLAIHATIFRLRDEMIKLVSFQDINKELEDKQMEAWQNLTKVLAHEIMNSVTPIASLSDTVQMLLKKDRRLQNGSYKFKKEAIDDVSEALETIESRSNGLIRFVDSYRDFTEDPKPTITLFSIKKLLERVRNLNKAEAEKRNINIDIDINPESLELTADIYLIEQVLINLIKNAFRALNEKQAGTISLSARMAKGSIYINVQDDGPGIKKEDLKKIFIPFYTTQRPYEKGGGGIGLSLSQKIMRAHSGSLSVESEPGKGTIFRLQF